MKHRTFDIALMCLWGVVCSLQFLVRGEGSYIRFKDEADSAHPTTLAVTHFPTNSVDPHWAHFSLCGFDNSSDKTGFYYIVQKFVPRWLGFVLLMVLQRVVASVFMYLFVKDTLSLGRIAAVTAGLVFPFYYSLSLFELGTYHGLAEPGIPMFAYVLGKIVKLRRAVSMLPLALVAGLVFGRTASLFIAQPFVLPALAFGLLVYVKPRARSALVTLLVFALGAVLADIGTVAAVLHILGETQRVAVRTADPPSFLGVLRRALLGPDSGLLGMSLKAGPLYAVCILAVLTGRLRGKAGYATAAALAFCNVLALFVPYLAVTVLGLRFFRSFDLERFYVPSYFFLTVLSALAVDGVDMSRLDVRTSSWRMSQVAALASGLTICVVSLAVPAYCDLATLATRPGLRRLLALLVVISVLALLTALTFNRRRLTNLGRALSLAVLPCFAVLTLFTRLVGDLNSPVTYSGIYSRPEYREVARRIDQSGQPFRVGTVFPSSTLMPAYALPSGLETADGYFNLYPSRYCLWWRKLIEGLRSRNAYIRRVFDRESGHRAYLFGERQVADRKPGFSFADAFNLNLLSLAGCRYFFSEYDVTDRRLHELNLGGELYVYENPQAFPRFFLASRTRVFADSSELLDSLAAAPVGQTARTAFLEASHAPPPLDSTMSPVPGAVTIGHYESDYVSLTVDCGAPAVLIATNNWSRFWRCRIDGQAVPVFPADFAFQGVYVPEGHHTVQLRYEPK